MSYCTDCAKYLNRIAELEAQLAEANAGLNNLAKRLCLNHAATMCGDRYQRNDGKCEICEMQVKLAACEWISVDERLPDDNEWVLLGGGDVICEQGVRRNDEFYLTRTDSYDEYIKVYPTHWMPLPDPPRQGKP